MHHSMTFSHVCLSVCLSVWAVIFECSDLETSGLIGYTMFNVILKVLDTKIAKIERMVTDQYLFVGLGGHVGRHIKLFRYVIV